jgi:hypothetical protein
MKWTKNKEEKIQSKNKSHTQQRENEPWNKGPFYPLNPPPSPYPKRPLLEV